MQAVNVAKAKAHLSKLLEEVESGQEIVITRRGQPVAILTRAPRSSHKPQLGLAIGKIKFKKGWDAPMTAAELDEFIGR
jgi:prevent-host-death family protein